MFSNQFPVGLKNLFSHMNKKLLLLFSLVFVFSKTFSQTYLTYAGARSSAMADASVTKHDVFAAFSNQACLAELEHTAVGVSVLNKFGIKELNTSALAFALPVSKKGDVFAVSLNYFGYNLFNRTKAGLGYSKKLSKVFNAAIQIDYINTKVAEGYGSISNITFEAGLLAKINPKLDAGVHIFNPLRTKIADYNDERLPAIIKAGLSYKISEKVLAAAETFKSIDEKAIYKFGLEYNPAKILFLRGGVTTEPVQFTFGIGVKWNNLGFDFSSGYYEPLGYSPALSLHYTFK